MTITGGRLIRAMLDDEDGHSESTNALHFCVEGNLRMNERIITLAAEAGFNRGDMERWDVTPLFEKFAELIVKECIRLCDEVDLAGADDCIDKIKDNFGVDE